MSFLYHTNYFQMKQTPLSILSKKTQKNQTSMRFTGFLC
ncbi:hypothetical protein RT43_GL001229 [Enterococcus italicus DSM 15952]|nr:hypothetical protein RT43_GL001229 [Enterococcus italicus DSM 15952]